LQVRRRAEQAAQLGRLVTGPGAGTGAGRAMRDTQGAQYEESRHAEDAEDGRAHDERCRRSPDQQRPVEGKHGGGQPCRGAQDHDDSCCGAGVHHAGTAVPVRAHLHTTRRDAVAKPHVAIDSSYRSLGSEGNTAQM